MDNFVWIVKEDNGEYEELKYSIRSVEKFHSKANIIVVGGKPSWYNGIHHNCKDISSCRFVNVWNCLEKVCEIYDAFVHLDDDHLLLKEYDPKFYYYEKDLLIKATGHINYLFPNGWAKESDFFPGYPKNEWTDYLLNTNYFVKCSKNYACIHSPLPIISYNFLEIAKRYPARLSSPSICRYQAYCSEEKFFDSIMIEKDFLVENNEWGNIEGNIEGILRKPFFSIREVTNKNKYILEGLYPI